MGVVVQRHGDVGVAHDVLQRLGIHTGVCHTGTERVPERMGGDIGQLLLVLLVVLLHKARNHGVNGGPGDGFRIDGDGHALRRHIVVAIVPHHLVIHGVGLGVDALGDIVRIAAVL